MLSYYEPRFFLPEEFVPPEVFDDLGERSLLTMDYRILKTADTIRGFFGKPVTINNWVWGGSRTMAGFRPMGSAIGAKWSQHKFGRAIDCLVRGVPAADVRRAILNEPNHFPYITVMEGAVSWLHVDCRSVAGQGINLIDP